MHTNSFSVSRVVGALVALCVSPVALGQSQRTEPLTNPQPHLSEPLQRLSEPSASGGSGSGTEGTTPILHESAKLTASDIRGRDRFGRSVSLSGTLAVVGAARHDCAMGINCGMAYVYRFNGSGWVEEQKMAASDATAGDSFGASVSVRGDTMLVGATGDDCVEGFNCGAAYVFRFDGTTWVEEQKLTATNASAHDGFGNSVSLNGDTAVVGAWFDDCGEGRYCGSAYVFSFNGTSWIEEQKLIASDAEKDDWFGVSVSVSVETAVVGSWFDGCAVGDRCGAAYVFRFNGASWVEQQKLTASDATAGDSFGASVSVRGDTMLVGASLNDDNGSRPGSAYVFRFDGTDWVEEQRLTASDAANDWFGVSVSLGGRTVVVGAPADDCAAGGNCGSAYVFRFNGTRWVEEQKLTSSDAAEGDMFGISVSLSGDTVVAGAFGDDCATGGIRSDCGSAYVFNIGPDELQVAIDIKPGNDANSVNLSARGVLPVAVLTTRVDDSDLIDFDAADVDPSSLTLAGAAPRMKGRSGHVGSFADIDGDGDLDLLVHFPIADLDLTEQDTEAVLLGQLFDGTPIRGSDTIDVRGIQRLGAEALHRAE